MAIKNRRTPPKNAMTYSVKDKPPITRLSDAQKTLEARAGVGKGTVTAGEKSKIKNASVIESKPTTNKFNQKPEVKDFSKAVQAGKDRVATAKYKMALDAGTARTNAAKEAGLKKAMDAGTSRINKAKLATATSVATKASIVGLGATMALGGVDRMNKTLDTVDAKAYQKRMDSLPKREHEMSQIDAANAKTFVTPKATTPTAKPTVAATPVTKPSTKVATKPTGKKQSPKAKPKAVAPVAPVKAKTATSDYKPQYAKVVDKSKYPGKLAAPAPSTSIQAPKKSTMKGDAAKSLSWLEDWQSRS